jgi:hypothetical protein
MMGLFLVFATIAAAVMVVEFWATVACIETHKLWNHEDVAYHATFATSCFLAFCLCLVAAIICAIEEK